MQMSKQFLLELSSGAERPKTKEARAFHLYGMPRYQVEHEADLKDIPVAVVQEALGYSPVCARSLAPRLLPAAPA